jgi:hypothetical protein
LGLAFREGPKNDGEESSAIIIIVRNIVVNSLHARAVLDRSFSAHWAVHKEKEQKEMCLGEHGKKMDEKYRRF